MTRFLLCLWTLVAGAAEGMASGRGVARNDKPGVDLAAHRGRAGWKGSIEEWYWLVGNPRRIAPDFFYGDDPFIDAAVRANAQTQPFLYGATPRTFSYQKGRRPFLERIVAEVTRGSKTDSERAEALLQWVYALRSDPRGEKGRYVPVLPKQWPEDLNAPERIIKHGGGSCEWVTRLFVALAQVADLPARLVLRRVHTQAEVYLDGRWVLFCPLMGDHGERFLNQPAAKFKGKSALEVYDPRDTRQHVAVASFFLGEEGRVRWLKLTPGPGKRQLAAPLPAGKPDLAASFKDGKLTLAPVSQPGPPEPLHMVPPKWSVVKDRLHIDFAPGLFFHLNQAVAGDEKWQDIAVAASVQRRPRPGHTPGLAGVVLRSRGHNCNAVLLQDDRNVLVLRVEDGWKLRVLAQFPVPLARDEPANLVVYCLGNSLKVWLDGRHLGEVTEGLWPAGKAGVAAVQSASFGDVKVWTKPAPPPLPSKPDVLVHSEELCVADVLEWDRLLLDGPVPGTQCMPEYSVDEGKSWRPVYRDHLLGDAEIRPGRICFRLKLPAEAPARLGVAYRTSPDLKPASGK